MKRAALLGGGLALLVAVAALAGSVPLVGELFHGDWLLFLALIVALGSYYAAHMTRGLSRATSASGPTGSCTGQREWCG
ncbi:MAG: hypothetical protein M5T61_04070 [Acidimicrobiia bacterium]|nr:hypothetical protein [Acidimicrobiia bacterium]